MDPKTNRITEASLAAASTAGFFELWLAERDINLEVHLAQTDAICNIVRDSGPINDAGRLAAAGIGLGRAGGAAGGHETVAQLFAHASANQRQSYLRLRV